MGTVRKTNGSSKPKPRVRSEKSIQTGILAWLRRAGYVHWRQNAGLLRQGTRRILLGVKGLPDIFVVVGPNGKLVGLEVKSAIGKQSEAQKEMQQRLESVGAVYRVVRSLQEAKEALGAGNTKSRAG